MNFPGFFGSFMNRSPFSGRDCVEVEGDPTADLLDREICETFREFENFFHHSGPLHPYVEHEAPNDNDRGRKDNDAQSLRDSILRSPGDDSWSSGDDSWSHHKRSDQDLDQQLAKDPRLLDEYLDGDKSPTRSIKGHSRKITIKSSVLPDGTRETTKIVVDSEGNEEVTVTRSKDHMTSHDYGDDELHRPDSLPGPFGKFLDWFSFKRK